MQKLFIAVVAAMLLSGVGCKSTSTSDKNGSSMSASQDDCPMCPGIQHARADGTCQKFGMKVKG